MKSQGPLVTIGIPTYNRANLIGRSIESALSQDYGNLEVIISDNASTDDTERICLYHCAQDARIRYLRQSKNCGPMANFRAVLQAGTGTFFMWLGDDDWIDPHYVSRCAKALVDDPAISLASGFAQYYHHGQHAFLGRAISLSSDAWWLRVLMYYARVSDNGMFYGLMRTAQLRQVAMPSVMGGDWHLIANIVGLGKAKIISEVSVHRELGGATASYQKIAGSLGLPRIHASFPFISIAVGAWVDITKRGAAFRQRSALARGLVGAAVVLVILARAMLRNPRKILRWIGRRF